MKIDERAGTVTFLIRVIPRASRNAIEGEYQDALKVRITSPPLDGRAKEAVKRMLAEALKLPVSAVRIIAGETNRTKRVAIEGVSRAAIENLAAGTS